MFENHPEIAKRWAKETPDFKDLPERKKRKRRRRGASSKPSRGYRKGDPLRFIWGHNSSAPRGPRPFRVGDHDVDPEIGCWLWRGWRTPKGYGRFQLAGKAKRAHHAYYERYKGPIPEGYELHHICGVRHCVNPDHLMALNPKDHAECGRKGWVPRPEYQRVVRMLEDLGVDPYAEA